MLKRTLKSQWNANDEKRHKTVVKLVFSIVASRRNFGLKQRYAYSPEIST